MDIQIVKATLAHAHAMAGRYREADDVECRALSGRSALEAAQDSVQNSHPGWAGLVDGICVCVFGAVPSGVEGAGVPWLLGSRELDDLPLSLARRSRKYIRQMLDEYPYLYNLVDARHEASLRWLKWCGFHIMEPPEPAGRNGELFHYFEMRRQ
jgi:hypothetical protein